MTRLQVEKALENLLNLECDRLSDLDSSISYGAVHAKYRCHQHIQCQAVELQKLQRATSTFTDVGVGGNVRMDHCLHFSSDFRSERSALLETRTALCQLFAAQD